MAKFVESQWSAKAGERLDYGSELGITSGSMCFYPMLRDGEKALHDLEKKQVTEPLCVPFISSQSRTVWILQ